MRTSALSGGVTVWGEFKVKIPTSRKSGEKWGTLQKEFAFSIELSFSKKYSARTILRRDKALKWIPAIRLRMSLVAKRNGSFRSDCVLLLGPARVFSTRICFCDA